MKSVKFQGDMLNFCDFIQVFVFTRNHHLKQPPFRVPLDCNIVQMILYYGVTCLKQPNFVLPLGDPLRQV